MRRCAKTLLWTVAALLYAGSASGVFIDVLETSGDTVYPSDEISMDVWLDTEGIAIIGYQFHVGYDPAVLSYVGWEPFTPPGFVSYGVNPEAPGVIIIDGISSVPWAGSAVVANLVFHVMDAPSSTITSVAPYLVDYGPTDSILLPDYVPIDPLEISLGAGVTLHVVPEPATALTLLVGLGLLGMFYARHRS